MKPKFASGDKVFAKVRGYPPWPARVEGLADETPHKMKYHIYFYGTGETAVVKAEDICTFVENKARLGKQKKPKSFKEALDQIEAELSPSELQKLAELEKNSNDTSIKDQSAGNISMNDSVGGDSAKKPSGAGKAKISTSPTPKISKPKDKKRKLDDSGSEDPEKKRATLNVSDNENSEGGKEVLSRSGRKIKPKRFVDYEEGSGDDQPISKPSIRGPAPITKKLLHLESEGISEMDDSVTFYVNSEKIKIPLTLNKPLFTQPEKEEEWKQKVMDYVSVLKKEIESGAIDSAKANEKMNIFTKTEAGKYSPSDHLQYNDHLKNEAQLLELDLGIRTALNIKNPDVEKCLGLLDQMINLPLRSIMLKKHPEIVFTIRKVRRYIGNVPAGYSEAEEKQFHKDAETIRSKADTIYNKFQSLFLIPPSKSFWEVFEEERENFYHNTKHLPCESLVSLVAEPGIDKQLTV